MKKYYLFVLMCFVAGMAIAQKNLTPTDSIVVSGLIKQPFSITLAQLLQQPSVALGDVVITNHAGEYKSIEKDVKAVALLPLLQAAVPDLPSPRLYSECYFVMQAADGYKALFSWNEIFNTAVGKQLWLVVATAGKQLSQMSDRMLMLCTADEKTGRRHIKSLSRIIVKRHVDE